MDSGNSSSMQSSSGGGGDQEEYDSRTDQSLSTFFNHNNNNTTSSNIVGQTQLDSLISNYFNTSWSTDHPPLWSTPRPPQPPPPLPPPISSSSEPIFLPNTLQQDLRVVSNSNTNTNTNTTSPICSVSTDKNKNGLGTIKNPRKRSRVSRRAPTTVLTTDTSNFRSMVQEFTGNPSTPFTRLSSPSSSSLFPRSRFDQLFGSSSSSSSTSRPLKPFPYKLIPPSTDYHQSLLLNTNMQNITNPFHSSGFGHVTNFEELNNIVVSSSSSTLNFIHGGNNSEAVNGNDLLRSINGGEDHQSMVQRSNGSG